MKYLFNDNCQRQNTKQLFGGFFCFFFVFYFMCVCVIFWFCLVCLFGWLVFRFFICLFVGFFCLFYLPSCASLLQSLKSTVVTSRSDLARAYDPIHYISIKANQCIAIPFCSVEQSCQIYHKNSRAFLLKIQLQ